MTWAKLDDGFFTHPKARAAGKDGRALFLAGLCYCAANNTDGLVITAAIPLVAALADVRPAVAARLVATGLWDQRPEGYLVHDYLEYNPSREQVEAERFKARERMKKNRGSSNERSPNEERGSPSVRANNGRSSHSPVPIPSPPLTSSSSLMSGEPVPDDVWMLIAQRKATRQSDIRNRQPWLAKCALNAMNELEDEAERYWSTYDLTIPELAEVLDVGPESSVLRYAKRREVAEL